MRSETLESVSAGVPSNLFRGIVSYARTAPPESGECCCLIRASHPSLVEGLGEMPQPEVTVHWFAAPEGEVMEELSDLRQRLFGRGRASVAQCGVPPGAACQ